MDVEKLKKLAGSVRMGGKGTMRRYVSLDLGHRGYANFSDTASWATRLFAHTGTRCDACLWDTMHSESNELLASFDPRTGDRVQVTSRFPADSSDTLMRGSSHFSAFRHSCVCFFCLFFSIATSPIADRPIPSSPPQPTASTRLRGSTAVDAHRELYVLSRLIPLNTAYRASSTQPVAII